MMNRFLILTLFTLLFAGCKNDIDINAKYKDVAIVYGFLDQNQSVQYLRIQKLYQNSGSLSTGEGAKNADSLYFDSLQVKVTNIANGNVYNCYRVDTIPKDSGFFSAAKNAFYAFTFPKNNNANEVFALDIYYPKKDIHFTSKTTLVKDATIPPRKVVLKLVPTNYVFLFSIKTGRNSYLYDLYVRYVYKEMNAADTSQFEIKSLDYSVTTGMPYAPEADYSEYIGCTKYIDFLKSKITYDPTKIRRTLDIQFHAYGGSSEFQEMLSLSNPNMSIVQKNPLYSNINNGIGIFTSRNLVFRSMEIDPTSLNLLATELPNFIR